MKEALETLEEMRVYCNNFVHASCDYSIYSDLIDFIDSATSDIEAQEAKSCEGCEFFGDDRKCWQTTIFKYISCERHTFELAMVDRYAPKATK